MKEKAQKTWVVFETPVGWIVSYKKLTEEEINSAYYESCIEIDYSNTVGIKMSEHKISAYWYSFEWTREDATKAAKELNLKRYNYFKIAVERDNDSEVG